MKGMLVIKSKEERKMILFLAVFCKCGFVRQWPEYCISESGLDLNSLLAVVTARLYRAANM